MVDIIDAAVKYTVKAISVARNAPNPREVLKKLRSRIRSMPSLLLQAGLRPTLAFYLSKTTTELVENMYRALSENKGGSGDISGKPDEISYAIASALLLKALGDYSEEALVCSELSGKLAECFDALRRNEPGIESYALAFLTEAKKIAEALIEEKEEG